METNFKNFGFCPYSAEATKNENISSYLYKCSKNSDIYAEYIRNPNERYRMEYTNGRGIKFTGLTTGFRFYTRTDIPTSFATDDESPNVFLCMSSDKFRNLGYSKYLKETEGKLHLDCNQNLLVIVETLSCLCAGHVMQNGQDELLVVKTQKIDTDTQTDTQTNINKCNKDCKEGVYMNIKTKLSDVFGGKNIAFGPASKNFSLSFTGAITFQGKSYDVINKVITDSAGLTLDVDGLLYTMPTQTLVVGDIIVSRDVANAEIAKYITSTSPLQAINLVSGVQETITPVSIFGMTFYSKVVNIFGGMSTEGNAMQNMLPLLLLNKDGGDGNDSLTTMLLLSSMSGGKGFNLFGAAPTPTDKK